MSAEHHKIDLSRYDGPMTVVGYPDLSALTHSPDPNALRDKASISSVHSGNRKPHRKSSHR